MQFHYQPRGVCSRRFHFDIEDGVIKDLKIEGGCDGNLQGIARLVVGRRVDDVIPSLEGIRCDLKPTSCPDQLAQALKAYLEELSQAS